VKGLVSVAPHNKHRASDRLSELPPPDRAAVRRLLARRRRRAEDTAAGVTRPVDIDQKTAAIIAQIGGWDPHTGASGMIARCAEDPSALSGLREIARHMERVFQIAHPLAYDSMRAKGSLAQDGKQPFGYGSLGVLAGSPRDTVRSAVNRGRDLMNIELEDAGVPVLDRVRELRRDRITAAGLAAVIPLPAIGRRRKAAGE
jgi:hypothetical protein